MKSINKILVGALSILVLAGPAFAQKKEQQKVDSLRRVKKRAERIIEGYQAFITVQENYDRINKELDTAIKAKEEADRKAKKAAEEAKQKAKRAAEEARKKAREAKGWKLYQKKFSTFELIEGIDKEVKLEIARQLGQDPNWDIKSVSGSALLNDPTPCGFHDSVIKIDGLNGSFSRVKIATDNGKAVAERIAKRQEELINLALKCRKDPVLLHETLRAQKAQAEREAAKTKAQEKMRQYFSNYYKGYTGEELDWVPRCNTMEIYAVDIPRWTDTMNRRERYERFRFNKGYLLEENMGEVKSGGPYLYSKCDGAEFLPIAHSVDHKFFWETDWHRRFKGIVQGKLVKTLKVEDFM